MTDTVLTTIAGGVGRIRLNRPRAIHALDTAMCGAILDALTAWRADPAVKIVTIDHAPSPDGDPHGARGFCAGGDIRMLAQSGATDGAEARAFFHVEYRMNHALFTYAKPSVAFMDGVTMGGGVGLACPCAFRIATENTRFAMPESAIGLFPDVGGGWYLSRLPGRMGEYLALTGARLDGAECKALGLATHYLPGAALDRVKAALTGGDADAAAILDAVAVAAPDAAILARQGAIDRLFAPGTLEDILAALGQDGSDWAARQRAVIAGKSPTSCKVALRELAASRRLVDFADELRMEYSIAARLCRHPDFREGVRALIVDKDNAPRWNPPTPAGVSEAMLDAIFAPLDPGTAWEPDRG